MKYILSLLCVIVLVSVSSAQKLKYKDIYPQLEAKNYKYSEKKLKEFLAEEKNKDHASGNLHMGMIWEHKVSEIDPIKEPSKVDECVTKAIGYFQAAGRLINEKELSKHEEFYNEYSRRDLRTGKFGVKMSDVSFDIEERIAKLEKSRVDLAEAKTSLNKASESYKEEQVLFLKIRKLGPNETSYCMRAASSTETIKALKRIQVLQPKVVEALAAAKKSIGMLPKKPFDVDPQWLEINDFLEEGDTKSMFMKGDFKVWDYAAWADKMLSRVENEIRPIMATALKYDIGLNDEIQRVKESPYMEFNSISKDINEAPITQLRTLNKNPYIEKLFELKIKELPVHFYLNTNINPSALDTADVDYHLWYCDTLLSTVNDYDTLLQELLKAKFSYANWAVFLNGQFKNKEGYQQYLQDKKDWASALKKAWIERKAYWVDRSLWAVQEGGLKPIPMFPLTGMRVDSAYQCNYITLNTKYDSISGNYLVIGVELFDGDKKKGYIANVSNARKVIWKKNFTLGKVIFGGADVAASGMFSGTEKNRIVFCLYTPSQGVTSNTAFVKTDLNGNIKWKTMYAAQSKPEHFVYNPQAREISVYFGDITDPSTYVLRLDVYGKIKKIR